MEACFTTSNSFTRTIELFPSIKARSLTHPQRKASRFQCRKASYPSSITCKSSNFFTVALYGCYLGSQSSFEDGERPFVSVDRRSFRARLVAGEQAPRRLEELSSMIDPNSAVEHPPPTTIGDQWVRTIHEPEKGCLLIATEKLDTVLIFERTVILLLSTGPVGTTGIILNRTSLMSIKETRSTVLDVAGTFSDRPLFFGGPMEEGLFPVNRPPKGDDDDGVVKSGHFEEVMKGLYYGTRESVGCAAEMVKRNAVGIEDFASLMAIAGGRRSS